MSEPTCSIDGCTKLVLARGWCTTHYGRWTRNGDPVAVKSQQTKKACSVEECERPQLARGYCSLHYGRWKKYGDAAALPPSESRPKTCTVEGCDDPVAGRGWCLKHYTRWRNTGDPLGLKRKQAGPCRVDGCARQGNGGYGWCQTHYRRYWRHGDPLASSRIVGDDETRFWSYVNQDGPVPDIRPDLGPCWIWTGGTSPDGYGIMRIDRRTEYMPRWAYELLIGPIPDGREPDHLCRVPACVNPDHLEPVTHKVNVLRGESPQAINARKTHCVHGHPFDEANTARTRSGHRRCRACTREQGRNRRR